MQIYKTNLNYQQKKSPQILRGLSKIKNMQKPNLIQMFLSLLSFVYFPLVLKQVLYFYT
jgi:hypothetical protein